MNQYDFFNILQQHSDNKKDKAFDEFLKAVVRKKRIIFLSLLLSLTIAYLYNTVTIPRYQSSVLLKKENPENNTLGDEFRDIFTLHKKELIETEMKMVKTRTVLKNVSKELKLYFAIDKIITRGNNVTEINRPLPEYKYEFSDNKPLAKSYPQFLEIEMSPENPSAQFIIKKVSSNNYQLCNPVSGKVLSTSLDSNAIQFNYSNYYMMIYWPYAKTGSELYISFKNLNSSAGSLLGSVTTEQIENTDIFQINVSSTSPYLSSLIVNTIAEVYKQTRIEQQKESIRYSFNFIDQQLQDVSKKLKTAEENLSNFKTSNQIVTIGEKSGSLIEYLSTLEAEKIRTNIELAEYEIKMKEIEKEYKDKGIFDQTYLTPEPTKTNNYSPFSILQQQLASLELQKIELLKKRTLSHPDVINIDHQIEQVNRELAKFNQNTLSAYQVLINSAKKKQTELQKLSGSYEERIGNIPPQESRLSELLRERAVYDKVFTLLLNKREEMRIAELSKLQDLIVIEPAIGSDSKVSPNKFLNYLLSLIFGGLAGLIIVWFSDKFNKKLDNLNDIEEKFNLPIFGIIPTYSRSSVKQINKAADYNERFVIFMSNIDKYKESFNFLKIKIGFAIKENPKIIMFTSCEEHTGKTSILVHLAMFLASQNKKVLLVDCDFKRARLSEMYDLLPGTPGLHDYLINGESFPTSYNLLQYREKNKTFKALDIIPSGAIVKNSASLLDSEKMTQLINLLKNSSYDYVLFDTPPVIRVVDALVLGSLIKNTILVIRPDTTYLESVTWGIKEMEIHGLKIWGTVVNACDIERSAFRHKYGYGYDYQYSLNKRQNGKSVKKIEPKELPQ